MRFRRIRVRDYRGVTSCELELLPEHEEAGITIVEGPNEVGKSSLAEALSLLWTYPHSSRHRDVRAVQPVGRDIGSSVAVDLDDDEVAFTYEKTFNRDTSAVLHVRRPRTEQLTGKQAHERAEELLGQMVDRELWQALQLPQGHVGQPEIADAPGLAAALARSGQQGGRTLVDERDLRVAAFVGAELDRWRTGSGRDRKRVREAEALVGRLRQEHDEAAAVLAAVAEDVREIARLRAGLPAQREAVGSSSAQLLELGAMRERVDDLERRRRDQLLRVERIDAELVHVGVAVDARRTLLDEIEAAADDLRRAEEARPDAATLEAARHAREQREREVATADAARWRAREAAEAARATFDAVSDRRELARLEDLRARLADTAERIAGADEVLGRLRVTPAVVADLRQADREVALARAECAAAAGEVVIEALRGTTVARDDDTVALGAGERMSAAADGTVQLQIGDLAVVTVTAGAATQPARRRVEAAERERDRLSEACGCPDLDEAERALEELARVNRERDAAMAERTALLAQAGVEDIDARMATCRSRLHARGEGFLAVPGAVVLADAEQAREARDRAAQDLAAAEAALEAANEALRGAATVEASARTAAETARARVELADAAHRQLVARLDRARAEEPDDALDAHLADLHRQRSEAAAAAALLDDELAALDPGSLRERTASLRGAVQSGTARIAEDERRLAALESAVATRSDDGPQSRLDGVAARLARAESTLAHARGQADAAALVHDLFTQHRSDQRQRYLAPLADEIVRLGRILWGPTFGVDLDDDLRIATRLLDGRALPFDQLSLGAREQLALISRLACAIVVGRRGAPLIIDDALGFSDPERLRRMGAVLAVAGRSCQIVLLTCHPQRYLHVTGARTVRLAPSTEGQKDAGRGTGAAA